jgi:hypothetical protein
LSDRYGTLQDAKERFHTKLGTADGAFAQVDHVLKPVPSEYGEGRPDYRLSTDADGKAATGAKRKRVPKIVHPLPGNQSLSVDEKIRAFAALETAGLPKRKIEVMLGWTRKYTNDLAVRNPDALDAARSDMVKFTQEKLNTAQTYLVGAVSDAIPVAMETFTDLMEDKDTSPTVRLKAASKIVDIMQQRGSQAAAGAEAIRAAGDVAIGMMDRTRGRDEYIVDVEAKEIQSGA